MRLSVLLLAFIATLAWASPTKHPVAHIYELGGRPFACIQSVHDGNDDEWQSLCAPVIPPFVPCLETATTISCGQVPAGVRR